MKAPVEITSEVCECDRILEEVREDKYRNGDETQVHVRAGIPEVRRAWYLS